MRCMRWLMCAIVASALSQQASAADMPSFLRGSTTFEAPPPSWDGIYVGVQGGWNLAGANFTETTSGFATLVTIPSMSVAPTMTPFGTTDHAGSHFGGFIGYNTQWDGAVISVEGNYARYNSTVSAINTFRGNYTAVDGLSYPYSGNGTTTVSLTDLATFRVRGGWVAGNFMPYAMVGLAVARTDITRVGVITLQAPAGVPVAPALTITQTMTGQAAYGWSAGVGLDFALTNNFFVRAEYEYVQFGDLQSVNLHMHSLRVAGAFKF